MKTLKNYKKLFADFWGYHENDIPACWYCNKAHSDKSLNEQFKRILTARLKNNRQEKIEFWIKCKTPVNLVKKQIARLDEKYRKYGIGDFND